jgi:putative addiction module killer protein
VEVVIRYSVRIFVGKNGRSPFQEWFHGLKDERTQAVIINRINRLSLGNLGDCKKIGKIFELRIDFGPGYRIYFGLEHQKIIILLSGGSKRTQKKDILRANIFWKEYGE